MAASLVLGLDTASTRWHMVGTSETGRLVLACKKVPDSWSADRRRQELCVSLVEHLAYVDMLRMPGVPWHIFAEEPLALKNGKTTRVLGLAAGALWAQHLSFSLYWHWMDVATWQAMCGVKPGMKTPEIKALSREYAIAHGADPEWEEDHFDAFNLHLRGRQFLDGS